MFLLSLFAQVFSTKAQSLVRLPMANGDQAFRPIAADAAGFVHLLVEGDPEVVATLARKMGGDLKYAIDRYCAVRVPAQHWREWPGQPEIETFGGAGYPIRPLADTMLVHSRVDSVHGGFAPLDQPYTGAGVVVGLVDLGIDYTHPDFQTAMGHTRIKYIWDQLLPDDGSAPAPYGYGIECDSLSIATGACPHVDPNLNYSHGTGAAGIAAGNGLATGQYIGVAPEADIIAVNLAFGSAFSSNVVDAVRYIFERADALGKPCVINTSVGAYLGSHDGRDPAAQMIDALLEEQAGRVLVAAVGNAGDRIFHLGYEAGSDTAFHWFRYESGLGAAYIQAWIDTADADGWNFALGADQPSNWSFRGRSPFFNLHTDMDLSSGLDSLEYSLYNGPNRLGFLKCWVSRQASAYLVEVAVFPDSTSLRWRLETTGSGRMDVWSDPAVTGTSYLFRGADLPPASSLPDIVNYREPDLEQTLVSSWQCSDKVITVGSYYNRNAMINYYGNSPTISGTPETRILSSSNGPTRQGRIKPDVSASGQWVIATGSTLMTNWLIGLGAANYIAQGGRHYLQGGTSFSSPIVAGIAALYLERYPDANWLSVKDAILQGARKDSFTGTALPNNQWGYGKVNAFASLQVPDEPCPAPDGVMITHVTSDAARIEWNPVPQAHGFGLLGHRLGTDRYVLRLSYLPYEVIRPLRPSADYSFRIRSLCGIIDSSEWVGPYTFSTTALRQKAGDSFLRLSPNPVNTHFFLDWSFDTGPVEWVLMDWSGRIVQSQTLYATRGSMSVERGDLAPGFYLYRVQRGDRLLHSGKLVAL